MKKAVLVVLIYLGVTNGAIAAEGNVEAGRLKIATCTACHSFDGNSLVPTYPKLAGQGEKYLIKQIRDIKAGRRTVPEMIGMVANLTEQDIADIAAFYASQKTSIGQSNSKLSKQGEALFRGGDLEKGIPACTGCHSPKALGNVLAGFPRLSGQHTDYIKKQLTDFREGYRTNDSDTHIMRNTAEKLSNKQIEQLATFLNGLY